MKEPVALLFASFASSEAVQELMAELLLSGAATEAGRLAILQAMRDANLKSWPAKWIDALLKSLKAGDSQLPAVIAAIRALKTCAERLRSNSGRTIGDER